MYQFSSVAQSSLTLCDPMDYSMPGFPVHHQLPESTLTHVHQVSDAIQPSHPLLPPSPPTFNLSQHGHLFQESVLHIRWPNYWSFSFSMSPSNEYSGLISFRMDCVLVTQWLTHLATILQFSAFFMVQLSHSYMTTGKNMALTIRTFVG